MPLRELKKQAKKHWAAVLSLLLLGYALGFATHYIFKVVS